MLFNSLSFLYLFLPVTWLGFRLLRSRNARYVWLTGAGYVFYGAWNYKFCALMALSTVVSYLAGLGLDSVRDLRRRRIFLVVPIVFDLALLGVFKYSNFAFQALSGIAGALGLPLHLPFFRIALPVGISFYTFHTITYIVDSYRGTIRPTRNFFEFSCYVSLFTQLVAGPIVRFNEVKNDLRQIDTAHERARADVGWSLFCLGLAKKVLLADTLAIIINPAFADYRHLGTLEAWLCVLGYTYQLYFDFSGYSDMAVGLGELFGIRIPRNFNSPYKALDPSDFWRRWHLSLSSCLRDYVYLPLGGRGGPWRTARNLLLTMLIGGLWHGANWTFVAWGAYHGFLLVAHRAGASRWEALPVPVRRAATFLFVTFGWILFRSESFGMSAPIVRTMFTCVPSTVVPTLGTLALLVAFATALTQASPNSLELGHRWGPVRSLGIAVLFVACLGLIFAGIESPFLYFQF